MRALLRRRWARAAAVVACAGLLAGGSAASSPATPRPIAGGAPGIEAIPDTGARQDGDPTPSGLPSARAARPAPPPAPGLGGRGTGAAAPAGRGPHGAPPAGVPTIGELANRNGQDAYLGDTSRYGWIILQESEHGDIAAIKAANPSTKVLAYEDAAVTGGPPSCQHDAHPSTGVSYCVAASFHPDWFLTDSQGNRLTYCDYPSAYAMDIGNVAYQQAWAGNVAAVLQRDGWDGVFIDDVNTSPGHCLDGRIARYTDAQYGNAMAGFVRAVAPALRSGGLMTVGNVAADPWTSWQESIAERIAASIGGFFREFWQRWGGGSEVFTDAQWSALMTQAERVQAAGAAFLANTYGSMSEAAVMVYARASWLLAWNGSTGASTWDPGNAVPYAPAWTTSVGTPLASRHAVGKGWRRDFTGGTVLVNPSSSVSQTFPLQGSYVRSTGGVVSGSVTLQPGTAVVLLPA